MNDNKVAVTINEGYLKLSSLKSGLGEVNELYIDGVKTEFTSREGILYFSETTVKEGIVCIK